MRAGGSGNGAFSRPQFTSANLESIRPVRDEHGRMRMRWSYGFEYSDTGHNRRSGHVCLIGDTLVAVDIEPRPAPDGDLLH